MGGEECAKMDESSLVNSRAATGANMNAEGHGIVSGSRNGWRIPFPIFQMENAFPLRSRDLL